MTAESNAVARAVSPPAAGSRLRRVPTVRLRLPFRDRGGVPRGSDDPGGPAAAAKTLSGHLTELRNRLVVAALSLIPGSAVGFVLSGQIIHVLKAPLPTDKPLVALGLTEPFMIQLKVAMTAGVILAMPVILYEFWAFISPGLTPQERAAAKPWLPLAMFFFAVGVGVAYFILPYASGFLYGFQSSDITLMLTADAYFGFVTTLFLAFGLVMEYPIVLVLLSKMGIVTSGRLASSRRGAVLAIVVLSAVVTPGADLVSPIVMAIVMYVLYEASIVMIRIGGR